MQILGTGQHVLILAVATGLRLLSVAKALPVTHTTAIVDRQHHVTLTRQPLIVGVRPVVELHVVIAKHHLTLRTAMHKHHRGPLFTRLHVLGNEKLIVDLQAIRRLGDHDLRCHMRRAREILAQLGEDDRGRGALSRHEGD